MTILQTADKFDRGMPVSFLITFLLVALDEGQLSSEYARRAGIDRFQMSRHMKILGASRHGWIKVHTLRPNAKQVFLTEKGRDLVVFVRAQLQQETPADIIEARRLRRQFGPYNRAFARENPMT